MNINKWLQANTTELNNKIAVVTGATGGLGREICRELARLGAHIVLACRNEKLSNSLKDELLKDFPDARIDYLSLDLSSMESVNSFIKSVKKFDGIDIFINNAGVYNVPLKTLDSGYNNIFQINFLYTYYLTRELIPELEKRENSVCVTLGSIAHNYSHIDLSDIDFSTYKKPSKIYGNSKRYLMFSLFQLFESKKTRLSIVHPGVTLTNMTNHYPKAINWLVKLGIKLVFPSPRQAVLSVIKGIYQSPDFEQWIGPSICNIWGKPKVQTLNTVSKEEYSDICRITDLLMEEIYHNPKK